MKTLLWTVATCLVLGLGFVTAKAYQDHAPSFAVEDHKHLEGDCGVWHAKMMMAGNVMGEAIETTSMACDGLWQVSHFKGEFSGMPFEGRGLMGFDPAKGKFVTTWVDSWTPSLTLMEGTASEDGKIITMSYDGPNQAGEMVKHIHIRTIKDEDHRSLEMIEVAKDGTKMNTMTIEYSRKKETDK